MKHLITLPLEFSPTLRSVLATSFAAFALTSPAWAGTPRLSHAMPAGAQRGSEVEVTCTGTNLADARGFLFEEPGFEAEVLPKAAGNNFKAKIKVPANARLGEHRFRVITASGISDVRLFFVTPFAVVAENEDKANPKAVQPIPLNSTVSGRTQEDDVDRFSVELKKGQRVSIEVMGARLHTQTLYDPVVTVGKEDGTLLVEVDDASLTQQDPTLSFVAPEDGKYFVVIRDSTNTGGGQAQYLMNIGEFARPLVAFPAGGPAGEELKVQLLGDASGVIEERVKLPDTATERFDLYVQKGQPTTQPNFLRVSYFPNALEVEPNNDINTSTPTNMEPALAANGIIQQKDDVDCFKFTAKKGVAYDVNVFARKVRSPLDSVIDIYNEKGGRVGGNDDSGGVDSYVRWTAPADGVYHLAIRDQLMRGGPTFVYRVELTPVQPKVTAWLPEMTINQNQDRRAIPVPKGNRYASLVRIKRGDVGGDVKIDPIDLPPGVTASAAPIAKSVDTIPMVFEAAADAQPTAKAIDFKFELAEPPAGQKVVTAIEHSVDIIESGNQRPYYSIVENKLPVAVTDELPVKIQLVAPKAPLLQSGSLNLKIVAERKADFKGPLNLSLLYAPPGVASAGTQPIKEGQNEGVITISANANAAPAKWKVCIVGSADFGKGPTWFSTQLEEIEIAPSPVTGKIARSFVDQGDTTNITVKLEQKVPFEGKGKLQLLGLPPNTTAEPQEITKDSTEVVFTVKAEKNAPPGQHKQLFCQFALEKDGDTMTTAFGNGGILRIDKATVAQNEEPKK